MLQIHTNAQYYHLLGLQTKRFKSIIFLLGETRKASVDKRAGSCRCDAISALTGIQTVFHHDLQRHHAKEAESTKNSCDAISAPI